MSHKKPSRADAVHDDDDDLDAEDKKDSGEVKSQAEANKEALEAQGTGRKVDETIDPDAIPKGPGQEGFDAPAASAEPAHAADPSAAVAAASGENSGIRVGEPTSVEADPTNKPLPPGHRDTVVPRNPAHMVRPPVETLGSLEERVAKLEEKVFGKNK